MMKKRLDGYCMFWRIMGSFLCAGSLSVVILIITYLISGGPDLFLFCLLLIPAIAFLAGILLIYLSVKLMVIELEYKGYRAEAQLNLRTHTYYGTVSGLDEEIEGKNLSQLTQNFYNAITAADAEETE